MIGYSYQIKGEILLIFRPSNNMHKLIISILLFLSNPVTGNKSLINQQQYDLKKLRLQFGGDLTTAVFDMVESFPSDEVTICFDNLIGPDFLEILTKMLFQSDIFVRLFNMTNIENQDKYFEFMTKQIDNYEQSLSFFFAHHRFYEHILLEIYDRNLIRRNINYVFYYGTRPFDRYFVRNIHFAMKIFVVTNPRNDTYRLYFNQAKSHKEHHLEMINWWHDGTGLFYHPTVPNTVSVFKNFRGKVFNIPVLNKPPWFFVKYNNGSIEEVSGRDHRILSSLAHKLNFQFEYFDPPEKSQGIAENGELNGVLGLIWKREAEFFLGDVDLTFERLSFVEFSFITLADSGAFVTHAPSKLNEALALLRPFHWQVWPAIAITFMLVGPFLYLIIALPNAWQPRFRINSHARLLWDCTWYTVTILLKQSSGKEPSSSHKARFFIILLSISATYVLIDMYSANLTSLLARPGREKAINNLAQLEHAMLEKNYKLYVELHSSSYSLLENGTGIYGRLWELMNTRQQNYSVESVEEGVQLVRETTDTAIIAGRETLFFDIQNYGPSNFHLSEKLNTAYSAIAFQLGCPYIDEINRILMAMFEAGIITKLTENEYEKLGKQKENIPEDEKAVVPSSQKQSKRTAKINEDNEKLQPISLKMLQGAFYLLCIGIALSGIVLIFEIIIYKHFQTYRRYTKRQCKPIKKVSKKIRWKMQNFFLAIKRYYRTLMHDAFVGTLEYLE